jgi:methyl-accepting chemotaxis protein
MATRQISASASRAASGTQVVVENITTAGENISEVSGATRELLSASHELSDEFRTLDGRVQAFVATVRGTR